MMISYTIKKRRNGSFGRVRAKAAIDVTRRFNAVPTTVINTEFRMLRMKSGLAINTL
jgi:hypothetical protein